MDIEILPISISDVDDIAKAEEICFSEAWSYESVKAAVSAPFFYGVCAKRDGALLGYISLFFVLDEGQINNVAVLPKYRRQGIANALLEKITEFAVEKKLSFLTLEVRQNNTAARRLYEKHGFSEVGKRTNYYKNPTENAILYTKFF